MSLTRIHRRFQGLVGAVRFSAVLFGGLLFSVVLVGCDGEPGVDAGRRDAPPAMPSIELGTGEMAFEPITEGQDLEFILGPQGGYHFLASVRVDGIEPGNRGDRTDPRNPTTEFTAWVGDTRVDLMASSYTQGLDTVVGGPGYEMVGRLLILDIRSCPELENMQTRIEVTVSDADGVVLTDERTIRAVPHPNNR